ncbi:MAG: His/Gly/Thr/Pro-type tRNA ligase C-terminal domain-containing protein [Candidatus Odinarchaeota archaeon]
MVEKNLFNKTVEKKILIAPLTSEVIPYSFNIASAVRNLGYKTEVEILRRNIKRALTYAVNNNYNFIIFIGEKEIRESKITIKNLDSGEQYTINIEDITKILKPMVDAG